MTVEEAGRGSADAVGAVQTERRRRADSTAAPAVRPDSPGTRTFRRLQSSRSSAAPVLTPTPPVLASIAAHPLWLATAAAVGAVLGVLLAASTGFTATSVLQFSNVESDSSRTRQVGLTVERLATSSAVLEAAARSREVPTGVLASRVTAQWPQDTDLVAITALAPDADTAIADANAVARAVVEENRTSVQRQLSELRRDANQLLTRETLADEAAEAARRGQLGSSLASRQDAVSAQTNSLYLADTATTAAPAGLDRLTGAIAGLLAGLLLGALAAVLAGTRGVRLGSSARLRSLLPHVDLRGPGQAAEMAGHLVESGASALAVVALAGARDSSLDLAKDVADFVRGHRRTVTVVDVAALPTPEARRAALRHDSRLHVREAFGADLVIFVLDAQDEAFGMLVGQSAVQAAVVAKRRRTSLRTLSEVLTQLERARPVVVLTT